MGHDFDVIIAGAGPAGCAAALGLCGSGLRTAIFDRSEFPRSKVCGGALSERTVNRLKELSAPEGLYGRFTGSLNKVPSCGLRIFSPSLRISEFIFGDQNDNSSPGYICERSEFDQFMLNEALSCPQTEFFPGSKIESVRISPDGVKAVSGGRTFSSKIILCSSGSDPELAKSLSGGKLKMTRDVGISGVFDNIGNFSDSGLIDIYFLKETLPGYFWIFELPGNKANAGLYLPSEKAVSEKLNLKELFRQILEKYPVIGDRFRASKMTGGLKGSVMPMITGKPDGNSGICGDRYLIIGDAAGLIDPMNGEGIGNALTSAAYAAEAIRHAFRKNDFSASGLSLYTGLLNKKLGKELSRHRQIRKIFYENPALLEYSLRTINGIKLIKGIISHKLYKKNK